MGVRQYNLLVCLATMSCIPWPNEVSSLIVSTWLNLDLHEPHNTVTNMYKSWSATAARAGCTSLLCLLESV